MVDYSRLSDQLIEHEGVKLKPYKDTVGKIMAINEDIHRNIPWVHTLPEDKQLVVYDMAFNLGMPRFRTFRKMLEALHAGKYDKAAAEMLDSRWARQVGNRATKLAAMMRGAT